MDVESLQKSDRRRGSCLDIFFILSIIFLFVAVAAVAVGGAMFVMEVRTKLESKRPAYEFATSRQTGSAPDPAYKVHNFAYLEATSSLRQNITREECNPLFHHHLNDLCLSPPAGDLKTSTMQWAPVSYGAGNSVGSNFQFDKNQNSLKPVRVGTYFMYIELNFTCTFNCSEGLLIVHVDNKLTCEVKLPADSTSVSKKCWTVSQIDGQRLLTQMTLPKEGLENWKLELTGSGFGMFLVD
ncbi:hypothetical protein L3Q82_019509, partial [Scortum barcoo]